MWPTKSKAKSESWLKVKWTLEACSTEWAYALAKICVAGVGNFGKCLLCWSWTHLRSVSTFQSTLWWELWCHNDFFPIQCLYLITWKSIAKLYPVSTSTINSNRLNRASQKFWWKIASCIHTFRVIFFHIFPYQQLESKILLNIVQKLAKLGKNQQ